MIDHVAKAFAGRSVLEDVSFRVGVGECVGLCGENGAGKTTLLKIIMGLERADRGDVKVIDRASIGMVHQHFSLVPALTVAENVWLGKEPVKRGFEIDRHAAAEQTAALAKTLDLVIDPTRRVESLTVGEKQRVELLKAFRSDAKLLLLDEPTAVLGPHDIDAFLALLAKLTTRGVAIVMVTHKLKEIAAVCSRAVVLHRGRIVAEQAPTLASLPALADAMVGGGGNGAKALAPRVQRTGAKTTDVRLALTVEGAALAVHRGEILGVAGVEGNGQEALFRMLAGADAVEKGTLTLDGATMPASPAALRARGLRAIPADRHVDAVLAGASAFDNVRLGHDVSASDARAAMERFDVRPLDPELDIDHFSGGNQQKILFAREAASDDISAILVNQPSRGIDFLARDRIWSALAGLADKGTAVLVISSDTDELRALCDTLVVLYRGRLSQPRPIAEWTDEALGAALAGT